MLGYLVRRIGQNLILMVVLAVVVFFLLYLTGDPVALMLPPTATPAEVEQVRQRLGFDKPLPEQLVIFLRDAATGDLGASLRYKARVSELVGKALPPTLLLAGVSVAIATIAGVLLGVSAAVRRGGITEVLSLSLGVLGQALPVYWLGILLVLLFSVQLKWLPASGYGKAAHLVLPALTLGLYSAGRVTRIVRSEMLEVLRKNYVKVARAKGLSERVVVYKHALRNAAITIVTLIGIEFSTMLGGAVVTETVFAWPGIGRTLVQAALMRDFPVARGAILVIAVMFLAVNLVVDLCYGVLDPRIRFS